MNSIVITFLGDISLNDQYIEYADRNINPFQDLNKNLLQSDYIVGNLETVSEGIEGENLKKKLRIKTNRKTLTLLSNLNVGLLSLATNHVYDHLSSGFMITKEYLCQNKIDYIGAELKDTGREKYLIKKIKNKKFAFFNYVHLDTNPGYPQGCPLDVNIYNRENIVADIQNIKNNCDFIILLFHWGESNSYFPAPWQRKDARSFVNAGADLIIGHHPHVIQGYEQINKSYIFYSLGNFCFADIQYDNSIVEWNKNRNNKSIILNVHFEDSGEISFHVIPIYNNDGYIRINTESKKKIERLSSLLPFVSNKINWIFYRFYLLFIYKTYFFFFGNNRNPIQRLGTINRKKITRFFNILSDFIK